MAYTLEKDFAEVTSAEQIEDCALRAIYEMLIRNQNKEEPRVYTSSKEDVADAVRDFDPQEQIEYLDGDSWHIAILEEIVFEDHSYYSVDANMEDNRTIRKLQKPVNPYEELEENGKYKVTEVELDGQMWTVSDGAIRRRLSGCCDHKDFAGYVFKEHDGTYFIGYTCYGSITQSHAVGVRFKVGE